MGHWSLIVPFNIPRDSLRLPCSRHQARGAWGHTRAPEAPVLPNPQKQTQELVSSLSVQEGEKIYFWHPSGAYRKFHIGASLWLRWSTTCLQHRRHGFYPEIGRFPEKDGYPPSGGSHGQRSHWWGYGPWGCKQMDMMEGLSTYTQFMWTDTLVKYF